ncbi:MAG: glycosyltransferase family 2 protein [Erysipelotrichaceae bacterium]|nr:glycosyltransferase family 2 protein [Erysipelotrichaceae bacterium]
MNMNDKVTICMPAYNAEKHLKQTLNSILSQTWQNWELVVVDDGSTDKTSRICREYANRDSRINLIRQNNSGAPTARKTAVYSSVAEKNKWLMFCDADDIIPKDAVRKLVETTDRYETDMVCGVIRRMIKGFVLSGNNPHFLNINEPRMYKHDEIITDIFCCFFGIQGFPVSLCGKLFRYNYIREAIATDNVVHFTADDLIVTMQVVANIESMVLIPDVVYQYRMGGGTAAYSPTLLDDFVSLYRFRLPYIEQYQMRQDVRWFMDVELMYYTQTYLIQQVRKNGLDTIEDEIIKLNSIPEINSVAEVLSSKDSNVSKYAAMLYKKDVRGIADMIDTKIRNGRKKELLKRFLVR